MAFVSRTERLISFVPNQTSDLGPGQYITATNFTKHLHANKVPFCISSKREQIGGRSKTPGVGSYNLDANNKLNLMVQNQHQKFLDYKPILTDNLNYGNFVKSQDLGKKNGFLSNETRFKEKKDSKENPGPGAYIKEQEFRIFHDQRHMQEISEKKNPNFKPLSGSNCRILSIPNKNQGYGYEIVDDKLVILNDDPDLDLKYDGISGRIGPGRYEIEKPKIWHRKGTSWSKSKVERSGTSLGNKYKKNNKEKQGSIKSLRRSLEDDSTFHQSERSVVDGPKEFSKTSQGFFENKKYDKDNVYKHIKNKEMLYRNNVQTSKHRNLEGINQIIYRVRIPYLNLNLGNPRSWLLLQHG